MGDHNSGSVKVFHGCELPEPATPAGYAALIAEYDLNLPLPPRLTAIAERHQPSSTEEWQLLTPRHAPAITLEGQLEFALKWEGVDLNVLAALFCVVPDTDIADVIHRKPTGGYARRIWFLYEWLTERKLDIENPGKVRAVKIVNPEQQFALAKGKPSSRHKVIDNLPGTRAFCPMIRRTEELEKYGAMGLDNMAREIIDQMHPDLIARAAAFLLLDDSKASFTIEGEHPAAQRTARWGQAIGEAGSRSLSVSELEELQQIVIGDDRFLKLGLRREGGFVGSRDRTTLDPIPSHISARSEDLKDLVEGIVSYGERVLPHGMDPVVAAAAIAFGFVYIHPFEDGNGRIHRWLIHHALARATYNPPGVVFPISAVILRNINEYRSVLESFSRPLLPFIDWKATPRHNVEVLNETGDYYRFPDMTAHAEYLYQCVEQTVRLDLPYEVSYLAAYDTFAERIQEIADMPAHTIELLHHFLAQGEGSLSKRARSKEFEALTDEEVSFAEDLYEECFSEIPSRHHTQD